MRRLVTILLPVSMLLASSSIQAGNVISSVDKDGNVTFSDHTPAGAVTSREVRVDPIQPSQEGMDAAMETTRQLNEAADKAREVTDNARKIRQDQVEKRRGQIEAQQQRSQGEFAEPRLERRGVVIDGEEYESEYLDYIEQMQEAESNMEQEPGYIRESEPEYIE